MCPNQKLLAIKNRIGRKFNTGVSGFYRESIAVKTISFLASHGGSAAKEVIKAIESSCLNAKLGVVITNNLDSDIYEWCMTNDVHVSCISGNTHPDEIEKDKEIHNALSKVNTDLVVLSGYMKKIGPISLSAYKNKILNIHPSLLPAHGGQGMFGDRVHLSVLQSGDKQSGATVQVINEEYDEGPIVTQEIVQVLENDTVETLKKRVQSVEGKLYIRAIRKMT